MSFNNCHSEKGIAGNGNLASKDECCEMSANLTLRNISTMLFEEKLDENTNVFVDEAALQAVERSFYDILEQKYSPYSSVLQQLNVPQRYSNQIENENLPIPEFKRGMEEGMKFLPSIDTHKSTAVVRANMPRFHSEKENDSDIVQRRPKDGEGEYVKGKRRANNWEVSLMEAQKCKISVLHYKNRDATVDKVFLMHEEHYAKEAMRLRVIMQSGTTSCSKRGMNESFIDLRTLLIHCSEAIAVNDIRNATQLIKQIKKHSSPYGDGVQRMAHIFVNGLEARLNGINSKLHELLVPQGTRTDFLNALHMYLISCPTGMVRQHFINYTILSAIGKASKLHIINLGTELGFNWPSLIHELSVREDGRPKLRITNIESQASRLPADRIEVARQQLETFSRNFGVPVEYRVLETKWDKFCIDDLNIEKDEVVIVNCYHGFEYLQEVTDIMNNPKNQVLDIIRQIRPHVFIQSIINGSFNSSFFVDRFKQVLLHTSAMFDFFDATMPRNNRQRGFLENYIWGRVAINLIACEGSKRFVAAETYKQCHNRNTREGFEQLSLDHAILKRIQDKAREVYHESFFIHNDKEWILLGWKGRVTGAVSAWRLRQN